MSYTFLQQVKLSDEKYSKESESKQCMANENIIIDLDGINEPKEDWKVIELPQKQPSRHQTEDLTAPKNKKDSLVKRKARKSQPKTEEPQVVVQVNQIGVNIGLPHFLITESVSDDELANGASKMDEDDDDQQTESFLKKIKTLTPSAIIPDNLDKINELCMLPEDVNGDGHSIYKCNYNCPKAFATPYHLMVHMRKSHMCQYCLGTFTKINDLYEHVKDVHKTFNCLLCSKEFQSNGNLRQHMRKNHSIFLPAHISLLNLSDVAT